MSKAGRKNRTYPTREDDGVWSDKDVCAFLKISRHKLLQLEADPTEEFPKAFRLTGERGPKKRRPADVIAWLNRKARKAQERAA